jgi:hypothetical protein
MAMISHFICEKCLQGFVLVAGMELSDLTQAEGGSGADKLSMSEEGLSTLSRTRTSISVIDFINSLQLHEEKCDGKVVYKAEK